MITETRIIQKSQSLSRRSDNHTEKSRVLIVGLQDQSWNKGSVKNTDTKKASKRQFRIRTNNIFNKNGVLKRWIVYSVGKRSSLIRHLFLKLIYDELTKEEMNLLLSFNESTSNKSIYFAILAKRRKIPRKIVRKVLETVQIDKTKLPTRNEYLSSKISFTIKSETSPSIEKPKPYRGYSRGYKDGKGSKRTFEVEEFSSSPLIPGPKFEDEINVLLDFSMEVSRNPRNNNFLNVLQEFYETIK